MDHPIRWAGALRAGFALLFFAFLSSSTAFAGISSGQPGVEGTVRDQTGAVIRGAQVQLIQSGRVIAGAISDPAGVYFLTLPGAGRYQLRVSAPSFRAASIPIEISGDKTRRTDVTLRLNRLSQKVIVTATGLPTLQKDIGSAVTVLPLDQLKHTLGIAEPLRLVPGVQIEQSGQVGGTTALFLRGANSDAAKVLIDGVAVNDIGGGLDLAAIASTGVEKIEVLRGPNSTIYGADAMAGVVSLTTPEGTTPLPELNYLVEGGNFSTYSQQGTLSGERNSLDYFTGYSRFDTANSLPGSRTHLASLNANFGWSLAPESSLRVTAHHFRLAAGHPNALLLYGIPDNTKQENELSLGNVRFESQTAPRWHNSARYGLLRKRSLFSDFSPTGIPQYDSGGDLIGYLGAPVTIHGGNGFSVSGQAQYQYVETYPNFFAASADRDTVAGESDYRFSPYLTGLAAFKYEDERGYSGSPTSVIQRNIFDSTLQLAGQLGGRLHFVLGSGLENNGLFGFAASPRIALAYDLAPRGTSRTKLRASFGEGIKEPSLVDQGTSLYSLLSSLPGGPGMISRYGVRQVGPVDSRSFDGGVDQIFANDRVRLSLTLFHSRYTNGIEYVAQQGLLALGIPEPVVAAAPFGATLNSESFRAQGIELDGEARIREHWFARGGYTFLDAVIERSFTSDAIGPSFNPKFPGIAIGAFSPLVGARPFRRAPHTGYFSVIYSRPRFTARFTGSLVGRRDDTDFLSSDAHYQPTLLLPNRDLDPAYQRLDLMMSYSPAHHVALFTSMQNLLSEHQMGAFGFLSLPFAFQGGIRLSFGGESWQWK